MTDVGLVQQISEPQEYPTEAAQTSRALLLSVSILMLLASCTASGIASETTGVGTSPQDQSPVGSSNATTSTIPGATSSSTSTTLRDLTDVEERRPMVKGVDLVRYSTQIGSLVTLEYTAEPPAVMDVALGGYLEIVDGCLVVRDGPQRGTEDTIIALPPELRVASDVTGLNIKRGVNNNFYEPDFIPLGSWVWGEGGFFRIENTPCPGFEIVTSLREIHDWGTPDEAPTWDG